MEELSSNATQGQLAEASELDALLQQIYFDPLQLVAGDTAGDYPFLSSLFPDTDMTPAADLSDTVASASAANPGADAAWMFLGSNPDAGGAAVSPPVDAGQGTSPLAARAPQLPLPTSGSVPQEQQSASYQQQAQLQQLQGVSGLQHAHAGVWQSLADPLLDAPSMQHIQQLQMLLAQQQELRQRAAAAAAAGAALLMPYATASTAAAHGAPPAAPLQQQQQPQHFMQQQYQFQPAPAASHAAPSIPASAAPGHLHGLLGDAFGGAAPSAAASAAPSHMQVQQQQQQYQQQHQKQQQQQQQNWPPGWSAAGRQPAYGTAAAAPQQPQAPAHWQPAPQPLPQQQQQQHAWPGFNPPQQQQEPSAASYGVNGLPPAALQVPYTAQPGMAVQGPPQPLPGWVPMEHQQHQQPQQEPAAGGEGPAKRRNNRRGPVVTTAATSSMQFAGNSTQPPAEEQPMSRFKRNRLRHKQHMLDMEAEVARKLQQLQALSAQNAALKTKAEVLDKVIQFRDKQLRLLKVAGPAVYHSPSDSAVSVDGVGSSSKPAAATPLLLPAGVVGQQQQQQQLPQAGSGDLESFDKQLASLSNSSIGALASGGGHSRLIESAADVRCVSPEAAAAVVAVANALAELQVVGGTRRAAQQRPPPPAMDTAVLGKTLTEAGVSSLIFNGPEKSSGAPSSNPSSSSGSGLAGRPGPAGSGVAAGLHSTATSSQRQAAASPLGHNRSPPLQQASSDGIPQQQQQQQQQQPATVSSGGSQYLQLMEEFEARLAAVPDLTQLFKDMPLTESVRHWKWLLARLTTALLRLDQGDESMVPGIRQAIANTGFTCLNLAVLNPDVMLRFASLNMETNAVCDSNQLHAHWDAVLKVLELDDQQVAHTLNLLELLGPDLLRHVAARRTAVQAWQLVVEETRAGRCSSLERKQTDSRVIELNLQLEKQLDAVQVSYRREFSTLVLLHGTLMDQILTPVQVARLLVHSYPFFPNGLALTLALARRENWSATLPGAAVGGGLVARPGAQEGGGAAHVAPPAATTCC